MSPSPNAKAQNPTQIKIHIWLFLIWWVEPDAENKSTLCFAFYSQDWNLCVFVIKEQIDSENHWCRNRLHIPFMFNIAELSTCNGPATVYNWILPKLYSKINYITCITITHFQFMGQVNWRLQNLMIRAFLNINISTHLAVLTIAV